MSRPLVGALLMCAVGLGVALAAACPSAYGILIVVVGCWFAAPGLVVARRVYTRPARGLLPLVIGASWGYAASVMALLALWVAGVRGTALLLVLSPILAAMFLLPLAPAAALDGPAPHRRDAVALALLLLVIPLVVARPWSRVGELTPDGRTYRAYFTADFVWRMAVAAEVAHGEVPPKNQFYKGDDLRYYWAADLLPAVEYRALSRGVRLEGVLLANALVINVLFVGFLYAFARHWTHSPAAAALASAGALLLGSFEGAERVYVFLRDGVPLELLRAYNIDAITRWVYGSLPVDNLHRALYWKPQHAMGYVLGGAALLIVWSARTPPGFRLMLLTGTSLALALFFSSFSAIMMTCIVAIVAGVRYLRERRWKAMAAGAVAAAIPLVIAAAAALKLHYVDQGESIVRLLVNSLALRNLTTSIVLSFGAMLWGAVLGCALAARLRMLRHVAPLLAGIVVLFAFYFFVDVRDHQYVYVGWRAGDLLFVMFAGLTAFGLGEAWRTGRPLRIATAALGILLTALALPTLIIDLYNTQDTSNRARGPGFRWTVVLTPDELAGLEWVKRNTPADALVQVEPEVRGRETWAYIPAFAERRMAAGLPISMVPLDKYVAASARITAIYRTTDARAAYEQATAAGIDYLVVAPPEHDAYPDFVRAIEAAPQYFRPVFRNVGIQVYLVERDRSSVTHAR